MYAVGIQKKKLKMLIIINDTCNTVCMSALTNGIKLINYKKEKAQKRKKNNNIK